MPHYIYVCVGVCVCTCVHKVYLIIIIIIVFNNLLLMNLFQYNSSIKIESKVHK